jgi:Domain of unknown function (DUF4386)
MGLPTKLRMMDTTTEIVTNGGITRRQAALVSAVALLIIFVAAMVAEFTAHQGLVKPGQVAETAQNILSNPGRFHLGTLGFLLVLIAEVVLSWALYLYFAKVNAHLSMLATALRLMYTAIFAVALLQWVTGFRLLMDSSTADVGSVLSLQQEAMQSLRAFDDGWAIALVIFGLHLLVLGYLAIKSGFVPRILGGLLMVAAVAYMGDNLAKLLLSNYADYKAVFTVVVAVPAIVGELGLAIWLLVKGGKAKGEA